MIIKVKVCHHEREHRVTIRGACKQTCFGLLWLLGVEHAKTGLRNMVCAI